MHRIQGLQAYISLNFKLRLIGLYTKQCHSLHVGLPLTSKNLVYKVIGDWCSTDMQ